MVTVLRKWSCKIMYIYVAVTKKNIYINKIKIFRLFNYTSNLIFKNLITLSLPHPCHESITVDRSFSALWQGYLYRRSHFLCLETKIHLPSIAHSLSCHYYRIIFCPSHILYLYQDFFTVNRSFSVLPLGFFYRRSHILYLHQDFFTVDSPFSTMPLLSRAHSLSSSSPIV